MFKLFQIQVQKWCWLISLTMNIASTGRARSRKCRNYTFCTFKIFNWLRSSLFSHNKWKQHCLHHLIFEYLTEDIMTWSVTGPFGLAYFCGVVSLSFSFWLFSSLEDRLDLLRTVCWWKGHSFLYIQIMNELKCSYNSKKRHSSLDNYNFCEKER